MILELNKEMQNTFILVTHNKDLAFQLNKVYEIINKIIFSLFKDRNF